MIRVISIFRCTANFIHVPNGIPRSSFGRKSRGNLRLFFGYVKAIESVEECKPITLREEERLPFLPGWPPPPRSYRLHYDDLGPTTVPIPARQNVGLCTFDINLQEVDHGGPVLLAQF